MRIPIVLLGVSVALGGCTTFAPPDPPVCDGRHRRPANLYGSVLVPAAPAPEPEEANTVPDVELPPDVPTPVRPAPASAPGGCA